jgi:prepilin-type N-terminal cleavage/methylation domain-containing protein
MMRHGRGLTLIELMVGMTLLSLVLTLSAQVLVPCLNVWNVSQSQASLQQGAMLLQRKLSDEVAASDVRSVTTLNDPPAICFLSYTPDGAAQTNPYDTQSGEILWQQWVVYYLDAEDQLVYRKVWPNPSGGTQVPDLGTTLPSLTPTALSPTQVAALCTTTNGTERCVAIQAYDLAAQLALPSSLQIQLGFATQLGQQTFTLNKSFDVMVQN